MEVNLELLVGTDYFVVQQRAAMLFCMKRNLEKRLRKVKIYTSITGLSKEERETNKSNTKPSRPSAQYGILRWYIYSVMSLPCIRMADDVSQYYSLLYLLTLTTLNILH